MKKIMLLNASPRKNWNTAQILKAANLPSGQLYAMAVKHLLDLFGNFSFRTGYLEMRCSKSCYLRDVVHPLPDRPFQMPTLCGIPFVPIRCVLLPLS